MLIYHILDSAQWIDYQESEFWEPESVVTEGFIHCSFEPQLDDVIERYFKNEKAVIVLTIDSKKLDAKLVEEASTENEIYPHIYGVLNKDAVVETESREVNRD
ncbi:MAG: DUF952 domain-containing protein [Pyrinomonadaceae bacterium]